MLFINVYNDGIFIAKIQQLFHKVYNKVEQSAWLVGSNYVACLLSMLRNCNYRLNGPPCALTYRYNRSLAKSNSCIVCPIHQSVSLANEQLKVQFYYSNLSS